MSALKSPILVKRGSSVAKIYATPTTNGYESFTLCYYLSGERKREAFGSLKDARSRAEQVVDDLNRGFLFSASLPNADREAYLKAKGICDSLGMSVEAVCREYVQAAKLLQGGSVVTAARDYASRHVGMHAIAMKQLVAEFLSAKREGKQTSVGAKARKVSAKYLAGLKQRLETFSKAFNCSISAVTSADINTLVEGLPHSGTTKNNYVEAIRSLLEYAVFRHYLPADHRLLDRVALYEEETFEVEIFTPEEITKLLNAADQTMSVCFALGAFAGLRTAEVLRLDWSDIDSDLRYVRVGADKSKTKSRRIVPIQENLRSWLAPARRAEGPLWPSTEASFMKQQSNVAAAAEVKWKHNALRHSFCSYRLAITQDVSKTALEAGHSPEILFEHYREVVTPELAQAWFSVCPPVQNNIVQVFPNSSEQPAAVG